MPSDAGLSIFQRFPPRSLRRIDGSVGGKKKEKRGKRKKNQPDQRPMRRYNEEFLVGGRELGRQGPNKKRGNGRKDEVE